MPLPKDKAWFRAKRYGWGWGLPVRWQGWVAIAIYAVAMTASPLLLLLRDGDIYGVAVVIFATTTILTAALIALCMWKGERPRWRWGDPD